MTAVGQVCLVNYRKSGNWYRGIVRAIKGKGKVKIEFEDGEELNVEEKDILFLEEKKFTPLSFDEILKKQWFTFHSSTFALEGGSSVWWKAQVKSVQEIDGGKLLKLRFFNCPGFKEDIFVSDELERNTSAFFWTRFARLGVFETENTRSGKRTTSTAVEEEKSEVNTEVVEVKTEVKEECDQVAVTITTHASEFREAVRAMLFNDGMIGMIRGLALASSKNLRLRTARDINNARYLLMRRILSNPDRFVTVHFARDIIKIAFELDGEEEVDIEVGESIDDVKKGVTGKRSRDVFEGNSIGAVVYEV